MANTSFVICASPLVKTYLVQWHDRLLEDPNLIYDDKEPFSFDIPRGIKAFQVEFNKPILVKGSDDKEIVTLFNWLVGEAGQSHHETDIYGLVPFDPGIDMAGTLDNMAALEALAGGDPAAALKAKKELDKLQKDTALRMQKVRESVKKLSEARIKRAMKVVHNNLVQQWRTNMEQGLGKYPPSLAETLGSFALDAEIKAKAARGSPLLKGINELMQNVAT